MNSAPPETEVTAIVTYATDLGDANRKLRARFPEMTLDQRIAAIERVDRQRIEALAHVDQHGVVALARIEVAIHLCEFYRILDASTALPRPNDHNGRRTLRRPPAAPPA